MNLIIVSITLLALFVSWRSWVFAERAFSLSLFNNRFKLYYQLRKILLETREALSDRSGENTTAVMRRNSNDIRQLFFESEYLFENEIRNFLMRIADQIDPFGTYFFKNRNNGSLTLLIEDLLGNNEKQNLNSIFDRYLNHASFKKPINCWRNF